MQNTDVLMTLCNGQRDISWSTIVTDPWFWVG